MINAYKLFWSNYANFSGRTTRKNFWLAYLTSILINLILAGLFFVSAINDLPGLAQAVSIILGVFGFAIIIPNISIAVRRLNDSGKEWPYIFFVFIPVAGPIILFVFLCSKSVD